MHTIVEVDGIKIELTLSPERWQALTEKYKQNSQTILQTIAAMVSEMTRPLDGN